MAEQQTADFSLQTTNKHSTNSEEIRTIYHPTPYVVVLVPTKNRPELIRAISGVCEQTSKPHLLIVVGDAGSDLEILHRYGVKVEASIPTVLLLNAHSRTLSGAINTGIAHLLCQDADCENTYVALLDDDDTWEPGYLEKCISLAQDRNLDWVVAGIKRHESRIGDGIDLAIPERLSVSEFFSTNPHVQGSNLFVRLSTLLKAGGFDENLQSTTDRDLCIRLLNLGNTRVGFVQEHLVHHMAIGDDRLSTPGSLPKRNGLITFYQKYSPLMSAKDREMFLHRATTLFRCSMADFSFERGSN